VDSLDVYGGVIVQSGNAVPVGDNYIVSSGKVLTGAFYEYLHSSNAKDCLNSPEYFTIKVSGSVTDPCYEVN
jgi:hypothetical protein